jgi:hypothetical protein
MGISAEVLKDPLDAIEGRLAIDDPFLMIELVSESLEVLRGFEMADTAWEDKIIGLETSFEQAQELSFEQRRQDPNRDEEPFAA